MNQHYTSIEHKMQDDYDAIAPAFADSRYNMKWPELDQMVEQVKEGSSVLDLGCGSGRLCRLLGDKQIKYTGIDLSGEELKLAKQQCPSGEFVQGSMLSLSFDDQSFDEVFMIASLQHLLTEEQRKQSLVEAWRVLKNDGRLNITVKAFWQKRYISLFLDKQKGKKSLVSDVAKQIKWSDVFWPWKWKTDKIVYRYYHAFRKGELRKLIIDAGFKIEKIGYFKNGKRVRWYQAKNLVVIGRKVV